MRQIQDDELDLFRVFNTLWDGKWLILMIVIASAVLGALYSITKTPTYLSTIKLTIDTKPISYDLYDASLSFDRLFYSKELFGKWKKKSSSSITYEQFAKTTNINEYVLLGGNSQRIAKLILRKKVSSYIKINTNELAVLDEFYKYALHVSDAIIPKYLSVGKRELNLIEKRYKNKTANNIIIIEKLLSVDRFLSDINDGGKILEVSPPTIPEKIEPKIDRLIGIFSLYGLIFGILIVLVRAAYLKKKE